ncbi:MAG: AbrB/MazE/SpoVT family DNA-binding domain-containing protein [Propionibacteriaceae bacterium]|jgi:AbrB family looped-hinge helix DNA binding protein|nr:AbrB/MazE/SpoVT family DNA-binding domain-containing protein [Propionibacteriaceae bacterium]
MLLNSKGQVTIPAELRRSHGFVEGDEVDVVADGSGLRIVHTAPDAPRGKQLVERMRGRATTALSTDELMALLRDA